MQRLFIFPPLAGEGKLLHYRVLQLHAQQMAGPIAAHHDAIQSIGRVHGGAVVGDKDELREF